MTSKYRLQHKLLMIQSPIMSTEYRYFFDRNGKTIELTKGAFLIRRESRKAMLAAFPEIKVRSLGDDIWVGLDADGFELPVTRKIEYKRRPSLHECNARCMNGKCNGVCECQCGGKNHGVGRCA